MKAIQQEAEAMLDGTGKTQRVRINLENYPWELWRYLLSPNYDAAWHRLQMLKRLTGRETPEGFWMRYKALHERWRKAVEYYTQSEAAWRRLEAFMADAPSEVWTDIERIKADYKALGGLINGGLKSRVDSQVETGNPESLVQELQTEVEAALPKLEGLAGRIDVFLKDKQRELRHIINEVNLQAVNKVLGSRGEQVMQEPIPKATYNQTRQAYEAFNAAVVKKGRTFFDDAGRNTSWSLWVDIYKSLQEDCYQKSPEHTAYLNELEEMGLVEQTVRLK